MSIRSTREVICREKVYENWQKGYELVGEIVRCRDCKHSHMTSDGYCRHCDKLDAEGGAWYFEGDFFCAYGERREDGEACS